MRTGLDWTGLDDCTAGASDVSLTVPLPCLTPCLQNLRFQHCQATGERAGDMKQGHAHWETAADLRARSMVR